MSDTLLIHATTISLAGRAVVLRGKSGSGKSDLALQLLESPGTGLALEPLTVSLIADDQTLLVKRGADIFAAAPPQIRGLLEIRGLGIIPCNSIPEAQVALVVDLVTANKVERLPQPEDQLTEILGITLPRLLLDATLPSAAARLRVAFTIMVLNTLSSPA